MPLMTSRKYQVVYDCSLATTDTHHTEFMISKVKINLIHFTKIFQLFHA